MAHLFIDYRISQCISMATLTSAAARASDNFQENSLNKGKKAGIIIGLCILTFFSNICGVQVSTQLNNITTWKPTLNIKVYGNIERGVMWLKLSLIIGLFVLMIGVNLGSMWCRKLLDYHLESLTNIG
jgi:yeast amino acid transporter